MTTRPGGLVLDELAYAKGKRLTTLVRVTRQDGFVLRLTDHDRTLSFDGESFQPIILAGLSADRREAALKSGNQEATGLIDGSVITIPDLLGNKYRGAKVEQIVTHWDRPWAVIGTHVRWVRSLTWTGSRFVGTLEGRTQVLQRNAGGPLSGTWAQTCTHTLGDPLTCKKDISIGSGFAGAGAAVATITKQRWSFTFTVGTWPGSFEDQYFRDGAFTWMWSAPDVVSENTATTTATTLTDTTQTWTVDEHVGKWVRIKTASNGSVQGAAYAQITANTATVLTFESTAAMSGFASSTDYDICEECANVGVVSPIGGYLHTDRAVELTLPTPFAVEVGDSGIWVAGCDGLLSTCAGKFADADHPLNFGGDPFAPSAQQIIEPPEEA